MNIERYEQLIFYANELPTTKEKIEFISQYFLNNVSVDYVRLEAKKIVSNPQFLDMVHENNFDYSTDIGKKEVLSKVSELQQLSPEFEQLLFDGMGTPIEVPVYKPLKFGEPIQIDHYETKFTNFIKVADDIDKIPSNYHNGLIKNGNCDRFAPFIEQAMNDLGIDNYSINGKGELSHVWTIYKDEETNEWLHCDMTYLLYARDGKEMAGDCSPIEWAQATTIRMFEMQPTRTILGINNVALTIPVTKENQSFLLEQPSVLVETQRKIS